MSEPPAVAGGWFPKRVANRACGFFTKLNTKAPRKSDRRFRQGRTGARQSERSECDVRQRKRRRKSRRCRQLVSTPDRTMECGAKAEAWLSRPTIPLSDTESLTARHTVRRRLLS